MLTWNSWGFLWSRPAVSTVYITEALGSRHRGLTWGSLMSQWFARFHLLAVLCCVFVLSCVLEALGGKWGWRQWTELWAMLFVFFFPFHFILMEPLGDYMLKRDMLCSWKPIVLFGRLYCPGLCALGTPYDIPTFVFAKSTQACRAKLDIGLQMSFFTAKPLQ